MLQVATDNSSMTVRVSVLQVATDDFCMTVRLSMLQVATNDFCMTVRLSMLQVATDDSSMTVRLSVLQVATDNCSLICCPIVRRRKRKKTRDGRLERCPPRLPSPPTRTLAARIPHNPPNTQFLRGGKRTTQHHKNKHWQAMEGH